MGLNDEKQRSRSPRRDHVKALLEGAIRAFERRDVRRLGECLTLLLAAGDAGNDPEVQHMRAQGFLMASMVELMTGDEPAAAAHFASASDIGLALNGSEPQCELLHSQLIEFSLRSCPGIAKIDEPRVSNEGQFYVLALTHVLGACGLMARGADPGPDNADLIKVLGKAGPAISETTRMLLAATAFCIGKQATNLQRIGVGMNAYTAAARLLESVPRLGPPCSSIAGHLFTAMRFERQRMNDFQNAAKHQAQLIRYSVELAEGDLRSELEKQLELSSQIDEALARHDRERAARLAADYLSTMNETRREVLSEEALQTLHALADRPYRGKPVEMPSRAEGPDHHLQEMVRLRKELVDGPQDREAVSRYLHAMLGFMFCDDRSASSYAAGEFVRILRGYDGRDDSLVAVLILFGKFVARALQSIKLELIEHRFAKNLNPYLDPFARDQGALLVSHLVEAGRYGEALRYEALFHAEAANLPTPTISGALAREAALDKFCPLTASEREQVDLLKDEAREADPASTIELLACAGRTLVMGHARVDGAPAAEQPSAAYDVILLRFATHEGRTVVVLSGQFGESKKMLLAKPSELDEAALQVLRTLHRHLPDPLPCLRRLYDMVFAPLEGTLKALRARHLIVQASGVLRRVPFGALHDGTGYLIERFGFAVHPGTTPFMDGRGLRASVRAVSIAIARAPGQQAILEVEQESEDLQRILLHSGTGSIVNAIGREAPPVLGDTFTRLLAQRPSLLHISGHFDANQADAGESAFILADGSRYTLAQLAQTDLHGVDLAILLGCDTQAVSDVQDEMGVQALDALLLRMGVSSVIGTTFAVDSHYASLIFKAFLEEVFERRKHLSAALRDAVLATARASETGELMHPHWWAGITLSGGWIGWASEEPGMQPDDVA